MFRLYFPSKPPVTGVDSWSQSLLVGNPLQELRQLFAFFFAERGADYFAVLLRNSLQSLKGAFPFFGKIQRIKSSIFRMRLSFYQAALF